MAEGLMFQPAGAGEELAYMLPGAGYVNADDTGSDTYMIPGYGYFNEGVS